MKKHHSGFISSRNGSGQVEKQRKINFRSEPFLSNPSSRIQKNYQKNSKNLKTSSWLHFKPKQDEIGGKIETKFFSFLTVSTQPELENSKIIAKKFQKLENFIQASFKAETGRDKPKNRRKKIIPTHFYPTRVRKYKNNRKKNSKN